MDVTAPVTPLSAVIGLLNKKYTISYPENSREELEKAAELLNNKMIEAKKLSKFYDPEQTAIIAGLNLAHELLIAQQETQEATEITSPPLPDNTLPEENLELELDALEEEDIEEFEDLEYETDDETDEEDYEYEEEEEEDDAEIEDVEYEEDDDDDEYEDDGDDDEEEEDEPEEDDEDDEEEDDEDEDEDY